MAGFTQDLCPVERVLHVVADILDTDVLLELRAPLFPLFLCVRFCLCFLKGAHERAALVVQRPGVAQSRAAEPAV